MIPVDRFKDSNWLRKVDSAGNYPPLEHRTGEKFSASDVVGFLLKSSAKSITLQLPTDRKPRPPAGKSFPLAFAHRFPLVSSCSSDKAAELFPLNGYTWQLSPSHSCKYPWLVGDIAQRWSFFLA
jgi:hypothetical protein